ncbi:TonB-dependent receptor [Olivibacter sp. SDN3]|uniref:TonB-dependent receptor n=1 Tax=Olivibacter sp. SDN3 TaxID=2764720 RepID=UPI0016513AEA|nr:TonB-dependent receptor [Olivibacter sp. SDN3]QNL48382.1 TonB-dependent receptor [Olivibacter sp. SDN3]
MYKKNAAWNSWLCHSYSTKLFVVMKLIFMLTILFTHSFASIKAQLVTIEVKREPVKAVLLKLSKISGYDFIYNADLIRELPKVTLNVKREPIEKVLAQCFAPLQIDIVSREDETIVIKLKEAIPPSNIYTSYNLQQLIIEGRVLDQQGDPLEGVSVIVKDQPKIGTATDKDGYYTLKVTSGNTLVFSYTGYQRVEETINNRTQINMTLIEHESALDEVVVVGYGSVKRGDLTGAVSTVGEKDIQATPIVALDRAMQGRVAGVNVTTNSARPGGATTVRIRGTGSVNAGNEPLYVIDGFPTGNLNSININDIESMEVLKDASATAIYGSRGSNGVILVTTRRGKAGQSIITYDGYYGQQSVRRKIPLLNAQQFAEFVNDAYINNGSAPYFDGSSSERPLPSSLGVGTDWQDVILRTAPIQDHQLSAMGGSDKTRYAISLGYYGQEGIVHNSDFNRYSLRANLDSDVSSRLKVGLSAQGVYTHGNNARTEVDGNTSYGSIIPSALNYSPTFPVFNEDGSYYNNSGPLNGLQADNPYAMTQEFTNKNALIRFLANSYAEFRITDDLKFRSTLGADLQANKTSSYISRLVIAGATLGGSASVASSQTINWLNENTLTYDKQFGEVHQLNALLGYTYQQSDYETATARANTFNDDFAEYHNLGAASTLVPPVSEANQWRLISYIARVNYGYDDRFLLTLTGRRDGSSRFGPNNKFGFFPSGALAWKFNNEQWMQGIQPLSDAKLRISYGLSGNQEINNYRFLANIAPYAYVLGGALLSGNAPSGITNPNLRWEKNAQLDIGLDIGLFNNRLLLTSDYYIKTTSDLLFDVGVPTNSGFSNMLQNIGRVENRGFELAINSTNIDRGGFMWTTAFNITFNRNKVLALDNRNEFRSGTASDLHNTTMTPILMRVGTPIGNFFGFRTDGIFQNEVEINASAQPNAQPGDLRYIDMNGDGVINDDDRDIIGNANPDAFGGLNNTFSYKGFDLNIFIQGTFGNEILNYGTFDQMNMTGGNNQSSRVLDRWTPENPGNTVPRANAAGGSRLLSTLHVEDGSYIRFKNISIGYTFPKKWLQSLSVSECRVYLTGQNLFTITSYTGYDPEVNRFGNATISQGIDYGAYPAAKTYLFGLNLKF